MLLLLLLLPFRMLTADPAPRQTVSFLLTAPPGAPRYEVDVSEDLQSWTMMNTTTSAQNVVIDCEVARHPRRFYRVVPLP